MAFTVEFQPLGLRIQCDQDINALDAARQAGIQMMAVCGGEGTCGKCVIQILESKQIQQPTPTEIKHFSPQQLNAGFRLACVTTLAADTKLYIPATSIIEDQIMQTEGDPVQQDLLPAIKQTTIALTKAYLKDLSSDFSRVKNALGDPSLQANLDTMRRIPPILRENDWTVNLITHGDRVINATRKKIDTPLGLAVDVGSTKIACYLIDLDSGMVLTAKGTPNPQIAYGEDIMARLAFAIQSRENAEKLHTLTMDAISRTASDMCRRIYCEIHEVMDFCLVGNTAMHHLFLNLPTDSLAVSPFVPVVTDPLYPSADTLHLSAMPGAGVYAPPVKAGFIGSDHLAFLYATGFGKDDKIRLGIDIGTNTEIALQANGRIVSVSTASGPAFEGAHITFGMRAAPGAIEHVTIDDNGKTTIDVIGGQNAIGVCGSGILDAVAQLRARGLLNHRGRFVKDRSCIQVDHNGKPMFALSNGPQPVTLSQEDIDQILLAKGAIRAGIDVLMDHLQIKPDQVEEVVIAGAFGSYMLPEHAMGIGMLPALPLDRMRIVGNAAGTGAQMMLTSTHARQEAETLAEKIEYLELTVYPEFPIFYANGIRA